MKAVDQFGLARRFVRSKAQLVVVPVVTAPNSVELRMRMRTNRETEIEMTCLSAELVGTSPKPWTLAPDQCLECKSTVQNSLPHLYQQST